MLDLYKTGSIGIIFTNYLILHPLQFIQLHTDKIVIFII